MGTYGLIQKIADQVIIQSHLFFNKYRLTPQERRGMGVMTDENIE
jgi:hypothetical protein